MKRAVSIILAVAMFATMSASVFANNFVPSIEQKTAPKVIEIMVDGTPYGAVVMDKETEEIKEGAKLYDKNGSSTILEFITISAAEKMQVALPEIIQSITSAENQIKNVPDIGSLDADLGREIQKKIDDFYGDAQDKIEISSLVISDLFNASLVRDKVRIEPVEDGQKVRFIIEPNFGKDDFFVLLNNTDGTNWKVVDDVKFTDEGYLVITTDKLSVFAIAVEKAEDLPVDPHGPNSPQTSNQDSYAFLYAGFAVLCVGVAVFFFVKSKKRSKAQ